MRGCAGWRDAVADYALGGAADSALAAHLAVCRDCAEALRESRQAAGRMDAALRRQGAVEPPVYGPDRIMARVGERNRASASGWWRWVAVAGMAAILIAIVLWTRRPTPPTADVTALATWRSPTEGLLKPPVSAAWDTMPRLGEGFLEVRPSGETHAQ